MALTVAQLIGKPAFPDDFDMNRAYETGIKATGSASAIAVGRVVFHTTSTGLWALATSGSTGKMGVVPQGKPVNGDNDRNINLVTGARAEVYVELTGTVKPGSQVVPDAGGKVKMRTSEADQAVVGDYMGHYGEGSGLGSVANTAAITDGGAGEAGRIRLKGGIT